MMKGLHRHTRSEISRYFECTLMFVWFLLCFSLGFRRVWYKGHQWICLVLPFVGTVVMVGKAEPTALDHVGQLPKIAEDLL